MEKEIYEHCNCPECVGARNETTGNKSASVTGYACGDYVEHWRYSDEWHGEVMGFENGRVRVDVPGSKKGLLFWPQNMRKKKA
ncbi:hypothetical protein KAR91_36700 [Candidatus Pacearchaeota archaeon]|nr:hypothetical protein [Candidatus Pacearchaeota archaeon]